MNAIVGELRKEAAGLDAAALITRALNRFGQRIALATSFGAEDQVLTDLLCRATPRPRIFTLDTGRLPQQTYDTLEATRKRYSIRIEVLTPDSAELAEMLEEHGPNLFYNSVELRKRCCEVRKVRPLRKKLATLDAWLTGLRREQAVTRTALEPVEWDEGNGLVKVNPLVDWTTQEVWDHIRAHEVPYNALHDRGYPSIGCAPCTRPVGPGEDLRAGRWWWEEPQHKECGLHVVGGRLVRKAGQP